MAIGDNVPSKGRLKAGAWLPIPGGFYRVWVGGTGTLSFDTRDATGAALDVDIAPTNPSGTIFDAELVFDYNAYEVRVTATGTAFAEIR